MDDVYRLMTSDDSRSSATLGDRPRSRCEDTSRQALHLTLGHSPSSLDEHWMRRPLLAAGTPMIRSLPLDVPN